MRVASLAFSAFGMPELDRAPPLSAVDARATAFTTTRLKTPGRER
jgi:hypothetical protein